MTKTLLTGIATIGFLLSGAPAQAASPQVTVTEIVVFRDGHIDVRFSGNLGCGGFAATWGTIQAGLAGANADGVKAMLSTLQAAKLSGKKVVVESDGVNTWGLCNMYSVNLQ